MPVILAYSGLDRSPYDVKSIDPEGSTVINGAVVAPGMFAAVFMSECNVFGWLCLPSSDERGPLTPAQSFPHCLPCAMLSLRELPAGHQLTMLNGRRNGRRSTARIESLHASLESSLVSIQSQG